MTSRQATISSPAKRIAPGAPTAASYGYSAGAGYDLVTGLGSPDVTALVDALTNSPNPHFLVLPASRGVTLSSNSSSVVAVSVAPKEGFTGTITLTCTVSTSLAGATCSYDNSTVNTSGSVNLTIQTGSAQASQTGTVTVTGTNGSLTNSVVINVSVGVADFQITAGNASETVSQGGSTTDTITITPVQGFTGSVSFTCTGTTGLTCSLSPNPANIVSASPATTTLTVNASSSATTGSITITATSGTLTHTLQIPVTVSSVAADFTLTVASPVVSIPSGTAITDNLTIASVGGFSSDVALTCSVPSSLGTTTCTFSKAVVTGGSGASIVTIQGAVLSRDRGAPFPFRHRGLGEYATFVFALGIVFTAAPSRRHAKRALRNGIIGLFLLCVALGMTSCGGGSGGGGGTGPNPITGNLTITATGGGITHTTTINVTVH